MLKVISDFVDLQDNNHKYRTGDNYPRPGVEVTDARIDELKTSKNKLKKPLIQEEAEIDRPYEAPAAEEAEKKEEVKAYKPKRGRKKNAD